MRVELNMAGGTKNGFDKLMLLNVPALAKPFTKAELAPEALFKMLLGVPGASAPGPTKNWLYKGGLFRKLSATVAGKKSWKIPNPPRTTVSLPAPRGDQAKPKRGSQPILV